MAPLSPQTPEAAADSQLHAHDSNRVYQAVGNQYIYHHPAAAPAAVTNTLPRDTPAFTGRTAELQTLITAATQETDSAQAITIHAIDGMPGVGKTALAIHAGHLLRDRFPDGQLFIDLHAHTGQGPAEPADTLFALLSADGLPPGQIPTGLEERAARWRARMTGKRVLVVMDDAAGHDQVEPLLPATPGCLVLITSRRRLSGLGTRHAAVTLPLDTLPPDEAAALFVRLAGRPLTYTETRAVTELVRLCGYLPLAICLLAAKLRPEPLWKVTDLADDLAAAQDRLSQLHAEDIAVAAAFDLSYHNLPSARRRFFRRLGLHPGTDIDAHAAAALDGITSAAARRHLEALYDDHLLNQPMRGRYRMHDLIAEYARAHVAKERPTDRAQAIARILDYYQHTASLAETLITRRSDPRSLASSQHLSTDLRPRSPDQAVAWMRAEKANLLACTSYAMNQEQPQRLISLAAALSAFMDRAGPWHRAIEVHRAAASAAQQLHDRLAQADALQHLGAVLRRTGDYRAADHALHEALGIYCDLGDRLGQAGALNNLGVVRCLTDDYPAAVDVLQQALGIYCDLGDRLGQATALLRLGFVRRLTGDYSQAAEVLHQALTIYQELDDRLGQANAHHNLGVIRRMTDDHIGAANVLRQALEMYRELGDRLGQAGVLKHLGIIRRLTEDYAEAADFLHQALTLYHDLDDRLGQAAVLHNLGVLRRLTGDYASAAQALQRALVIYHNLGNRLGQAEVLNHGGALLLQCGKSLQAQIQYRIALQLARDVRSPLEEARALEGAARCALQQGDTMAAALGLRQALDIYQRIGAAETPRTAAQLADLSNPTSRR
jgi:tetratricopeptide (TPR) repeat protein